MTNEPASTESAGEDDRESGFSLLQYVRWWPVIALLYPLSIMPAYVALLVLRSQGIDLYVSFEVAYWPVLWVLRNFEWARNLNNLIEPLLRRLAAF
jgi:hypothetical protein